MKKMYIEDLPSRAKEIAPLLCRGLSNIEIANMLYVSHYTVRAHVVRMMKNTDSKNRMELAYKLGVYDREMKMLSYIKIKGKGNHEK